MSNMNLDRFKHEILKKFRVFYKIYYIFALNIEKLNKILYNMSYGKE